MHRTILVVDIESFGDPRRNNPIQLAVRAGLYRALAEAFHAARIPWDSCHHEDRGDGVMILAPADLPKAPFVDALPDALVAALRKHNAAHSGPLRIRLRMALHAGEVHPDDHGYTGTALNFTFRLLDAAPVKAALAGSQGVLALVVSPWFYEEVVHNSGSADPATFRPVPVRVKETTTTGWVARPDDPYPPATVAPRPVAGRARAAGVALVALLLAAGLASDGHAGTVNRGAVAVGVGADLSHGEEYVAKLVNRKTGKCLARNGAYTHPGNSERSGEAIYQWACAGSDNPGHTIVVGGGLVRSSIRADLCLAADGAPGKDQRFRPCEPDDDRQQWQLKRVIGRGADVVVVENRNTGMCLAPQEGDPEWDIQIFQAPCTLTPDGAVEWTIERYPPISGDDCQTWPRGRLRNHETGLHLGESEGDPLAQAEAGPVLRLEPGQRTAHGCARYLVDPAGSCLGAGPTGGDVRWQPCRDQSAMRWVIEPLGDEGGRSWARVHLSRDLSRCLQADDDAVTMRLCDDSWRQQWHLEVKER